MLESRMEKRDFQPAKTAGRIEYADQIFNIEMDGEFVCRDYLASQVLGPKFVREARKKELHVFESKGVWVKRKVEEAKRKTGKPPINVRLVDVNNGVDL